ncbi:MAG: dephospho-CoA kinase [Alphaproteobacteria bacterium]
MFILGLSGGMGMGKSTASLYLRKLHIPVYDSDAAVHFLMNKGQAVYTKLQNIIPNATQGNKVDRKVLSARIKDEPQFLDVLEGIIHPEVAKARNIFLWQQALKNQKIVALDVPLLFEIGLYKKCDAIAIVDCPKWLQIERILKRGVPKQKMEFLLSQQWCNKKRALYADYIIPTGLSFAHSYRAIRLMLKDISHKPAKAYQPCNFRI